MSPFPFYLRIILLMEKMSTSSRRASQQPARRVKLNNKALFNENDPKFIPIEMSVDKIILPSNQPRRYFDSEAMKSLVESVKHDGILQPLLVRPIGENYELVAGERRYKAAQAAALKSVPVIIREMSDQQALHYALTENLQREDLNPIEETEGILQLLALRLKCEIVNVSSLLHRMDNQAKGKITRNASCHSEVEIVEKVFTNLGKMNWQSFVRTRLPLLKLPNDILNALHAGRIEYTKALEIAKLESEQERTQLLEATIEIPLSLSQIKQRLKQQLKHKQLATQPLTIQTRLEKTYKQIKQFKVWENPHKRQKLEYLLVELEALVLG